MGARNLKEKNMASVADPGIPEEVASAQRGCTNLIFGKPKTA